MNLLQSGLAWLGIRIDHFFNGPPETDKVSGEDNKWMGWVLGLLGLVGPAFNRLLPRGWESLKPGGAGKTPNSPSNSNGCSAPSKIADRLGLGNFLLLRHVKKELETRRPSETNLSPDQLRASKDLQAKSLVQS